MSTALAIPDLAILACANLPSPNTRRVYERHIRAFLDSGYPLDRTGVSLWVQSMRANNVGPPTITQALAAIRKLADEARLHGMLTELDTWGISEVKQKTQPGNKAGMWLQKNQVKTLYSLPNRETLSGKRDAAIFALLIGCGLRRSEATSITWVHYAERDGRMALVDFIGKGGKIRTVGVSRGAARDLDAWLAVLEYYGVADDDSPILRNLRHEDDVSQPLSDSGLWCIVTQYAAEMHLDFSPHDLRRSMAKLMHKAGVELTQIQLILGHADLMTTKRYLGLDLELAPGLAGTDAIDIDLDEASKYLED